MSKFECLVVRIDDVFEHPNADKLELIKVGGYKIVSGKGNWNAGDVAVYLPEFSVLPINIQEQLEVVGFLSGSEKNILKTIKLRGETSEGMLLPICNLGNVNVGDDVAELIGVTKHIVRVPADFAGDVVAVHENVYPTSFDIENIKKHPNWIGDGESVDITEKLHGTYCQMILVDTVAAEVGDLQGFLNLSLEYQAGVTSKGMGSKNLSLDCNAESNLHNVYVQALKKYIDHSLISNLFNHSMSIHVVHHIASIQIMGEVYGGGIQDFAYDAEQEKKFRVFDIRYKDAYGKSYYLSPAQVRAVCKDVGLEMVPLLYEGKFTNGIVMRHTYGNSVLNDGQIKEGCVVRTTDPNRETFRGERIILKSVSEQYLTRKSRNGKELTEFN